MANGTDFIESSDAGLANQAQNTAAIVTPAAVAYGTTAAFMTQFGTASSDFADALAAHLTAADAARAARAAKEAARANLVSLFRQLNRTVQATATVTAEQKEAAGLPVHDGQRTPIPAPTDAPVVIQESVERLRLLVRILDGANPTRRGRPANVASYQLFYKVGDVAPASTADCVFAGNFTKTRVWLTFNPADAGKRVWIIAVAVNAKGDPSPMSESLEATIAA
jgi:hypothetical protein